MRRTATLASTAVALTLLLGACGGDDSGKTAAGAASKTTTAAKDSSVTTVAGDTSGGDTTTTDPNFSGKGSGDFCGFAKQIEKDQSSLGTGDNPDDLKKSMSSIDSVFDEAIGKAPAEIKDDFKAMKKGLDTVKDFYAQYDYDPTKLAAAAQKDPKAMADMEQAMSDPAFTAASGRIDAYMTKVCGIDTSGDDSTDTTTG